MSESTALATLDERQLSLRSPEHMESEALASLVIDGCQQFRRLIPYVIELKKRFEEATRGNANIAGCKTWTEFCENKLDRTRQAVHKALAAYNEKTLPPAANAETPNPIRNRPSVSKNS